MGSGVIECHEYQLGRLMPYHLATPASEKPSLRAVLYGCFAFWASDFLGNFTEEILTYCKNFRRLNRAS
jgi:hypothetical protein